MFNGLTLLCLVFIAVVFAYLYWPRPQRIADDVLDEFEAHEAAMNARAERLGYRRG